MKIKIILELLSNDVAKLHVLRYKKIIAHTYDYNKLSITSNFR